jgi:hypothetical protein
MSAADYPQLLLSIDAALSTLERLSFWDDACLPQISGGRVWTLDMPLPGPETDAEANARLQAESDKAAKRKRRDEFIEQLQNHALAIEAFLFANRIVIDDKADVLFAAAVAHREPHRKGIRERKQAIADAVLWLKRLKNKAEAKQSTKSQNDPRAETATADPQKVLRSAMDLSAAIERRTTADKSRDTWDASEWEMVFADENEETLDDQIFKQIHGGRTRAEVATDNRRRPLTEAIDAADKIIRTLLAELIDAAVAWDMEAKANAFLKLRRPDCSKADYRDADDAAQFIAAKARQKIAEPKAPDNPAQAPAPVLNVPRETVVQKSIEPMQPAMQAKRTGEIQKLAFLSYAEALKRQPGLEKKTLRQVFEWLRRNRIDIDGAKYELPSNYETWEKYRRDGERAARGEPDRAE